ncbi:cysteine desulfurase family protein [Geminicoccus roseus]|uniref:cysteine desulfurase family protein n=1 Tax=Geminicoccus roseus TaxID=404900 RepID=UPI0004037E0B|nr:cysteine desulfurase family protein [Geminicoccus roseus]
MPAEPRIYLDHAATSPVRPEVVARVAEVLAMVGNPSSVHAEGRAARRVLEDARAVLAEATGAGPDEIIFTSGGTEANDLALSVAAGGAVLVSAIEHASVLEAAPEALRLPVDRNGLVDLAVLERLLAAARPALVSVMLVNNETGVVQDIAAIASCCRKAGALLHVDAVQGFGKLEGVRVDRLGCDLMTVSAHKLGGPPGTGALLTRPGLAVPARLRGGGQEGRRRAGTHHLAGIAGFAEAIRRLDPAEPGRLEGLRARLEEGVRRLGDATWVAAARAARAPHIACLVTPGRPAEMQVIRMDLAGVAISAGAACSSGKVAASHVLAAMGLGADAGCGIRVSLGWSSGITEVDRFLQAFAAQHGTASNMSNRTGSPLPNPSAVAT